MKPPSPQEFAAIQAAFEVYMRRSNGRMSRWTLAARLATTNLDRITSPASPGDAWTLSRSVRRNDHAGKPA